MFLYCDFLIFVNDFFIYYFLPLLLPINEQVNYNYENNEI